MQYFSDLMMGFSIAMTPQNLMFALIGCILGTLVGVLPGLGPSAGTALAHPAHLQPASHRRHHHAGGHLLRLPVRRHHHQRADQRPRRGFLGHHLHRRLPDGPAGARRSCAGRGRHRVLRRGDHCRDGSRGCGAPDPLRPGVRPGGVLRLDGAGHDPGVGTGGQIHD